MGYGLQGQGHAMSSWIVGCAVIAVVAGWCGSVNAMDSGAREAAQLQARPSPPVPAFATTEGRMAYLRWLFALSPRLSIKIPDEPQRLGFLQTTWFEARRADLDPSLALATMETLSGFRKFFVSDNGARGYFAVNPEWSRKIGDHDPGVLFHLQTNQRFGTMLLRHYLDETGDTQQAVRLYVADSLQAFPTDTRVMRLTAAILAARTRWDYTDGYVSSSSHSSPRSIAIPVGPGGHLFLRGFVNGEPVRFLVDTGATNVTLTREIADAAQLRGGELTEFQTANGRQSMRVIEGVSVRAGPFTVPAATAIVPDGALGGEMLLGQSFLKHFDVLLTSRVMILRESPN